MAIPENFAVSRYNRIVIVRRAAKIACLLLLLPGIPAGVLWVRSYWVMDLVEWGGWRFATTIFASRPIDAPSAARPLPRKAAPDARRPHTA